MELVGRRDTAGLANSQLHLQYQSVCEQQKLALVRNGALLQDLKQFQHQTALATPKTDRLKVLKHQYEEHVAAVYPQWMAQVQEHRAWLSPEQQETSTETSVDSSSQSQDLPIAADQLLAQAATAASNTPHGLPSVSHMNATVAANVGDLSMSASDVSSPPSPGRPIAGHVPKPTLLPGMVSSSRYVGVSVALSGNMNVTPSTSTRPIMHTQEIPPPALATQLPTSIPPPIIASTAPQQPDPLRVTTEQKVPGSSPYHAPVLSPFQRPSRIPVLASRTKPKALPASSKVIPVKYGNATQPLSRMQVGTTAAAMREHTSQKTPGTSLALRQPEGSLAVRQPDGNLAFRDYCQTDKEQGGEATEIAKPSSPTSQALSSEEGSQHTVQLESTTIQGLEQVVKEPESSDSKPHMTPFPDETETAKLGVQEVPSPHSTEHDPVQLPADRPHPADPEQLLAGRLQPADPEQLPADRSHPADPAQLLADTLQPTEPAQLLADRPQSTDPVQLLADLSASLPSLSDNSQEAAPEKATPPATPTTSLSQPLAENLLPDHTNILPGERPELGRPGSQDEMFGHDIETTDSPLSGEKRSAGDITDVDIAQSPPDANAGSAPGDRNDDHSESSITESEPQDKKPQVQKPQSTEVAAGLPLDYSLLMQPPGVSPPSPLQLSEGSEIAELERELQASSGRAEGEGQPFSKGEPSKSSSLFPPVPPKVTAEDSGASQEDSESSLSPFSPAYIPTTIEQKSRASAASKSSALMRKLGFWGDSDSGSDLELQLPAALPPDSEQEDFD